MLDIHSEDELFKISSGFVYFYTPLCGTCKLANEFLLITEHLDQIPEIRKMDLNYANQTAMNWQIESVPCLVSLDKGEVQEKLYAFKSVPDVTAFINRMQEERS